VPPKRLVALSLVLHLAASKTTATHPQPRNSKQLEGQEEKRLQQKSFPASETTHQSTLSTSLLLLTLPLPEGLQVTDGSSASSSGIVPTEEDCESRALPAILLT